MLFILSLQLVQQLTEHNFDQKTEPIFVKFYAPWCGHCKTLKPAWEQLGEKLHTENSQVTIAELDCISERSVCSDQKIKGFPTLILFMNGNQYEYGGDRSVDSMYDWIQRMQGPTLSFYESEEEIKNTAKKFGQKIYYILHTHNLTPFQNIFQEFKGTHFVGAIKGQNKLQVVRDGITHTFKGNITSKKDIHSFILKNNIEPFTDLDDVPFHSFVRSGITMFLCDAENKAKKLKSTIKSLSQNDKFVSNLGFLTKNDRMVNFLKYHGANLNKPNLLGGIAINNHGKIFTKLVRYKSYDPSKNLEAQLKDFEQTLLRMRTKYESLVEQNKPLEGFLDSEAAKQVMMMINYNPMVQGLLLVSLISIVFLIGVICCYNPKPAPKQAVQQGQKQKTKQQSKGQKETTDQSKKNE